MSRVDELIRETAEQDWDGHGAEPIPAALWREAERVATTPPSLPTPFLSPGGNGGVNIRWSNDKGRMIDVELAEDQARPLTWTQKVDGVRTSGTFDFKADMLLRLHEMFG